MIINIGYVSWVWRFSWAICHRYDLGLMPVFEDERED